ncbi:MAG: MBL fold metallo-hydrolase [Deltaproteobacteria bacterium]|nr:MBL fold metallo-hydrolase [Deltaproteobacteria bacterium]
MGVTNLMAGTRIDEVADRVYRISTVVAGGTFSHNQYLIDDDDPLLFHTGSRRLAPFVMEAVSTIMPFACIRYLAFSHYESDECGALDAMLAAAPKGEPVCGRINTLINADAFDRPARTLADGEILALGRHRIRWLDAPHVPHGWECGFAFEEVTGMLLCGDLFSQGGGGLPPLSTSDLVGASEAFRRRVDYFSYAANTRRVLEHLAATGATSLGCMHGSAWEGDAPGALRALGDALALREERASSWRA